MPKSSRYVWKWTDIRELVHSIIKVYYNCFRNFKVPQGLQLVVLLSQVARCGISFDAKLQSNNNHQCFIAFSMTTDLITLLHKPSFLMSPLFVPPLFYLTFWCYKKYFWCYLTYMIVVFGV